MEVVTISIYVIPEASSCTMQLAHIIATTGLAITSVCMYSRGTLKVVVDNRSPHRQAVTSSKPKGGATTCIGSGDLGEGESHSATLLASPLLPFGVELSLPQNSGGGASTLTHQRPERLVPQ